jgi:hypothetical protein
MLLPVLLLRALLLQALLLHRWFHHLSLPKRV